MKPNQQQVDVNRVLQKLQARIGDVMMQNAILEARIEEMQSDVVQSDKPVDPVEEVGVAD